MKKILGMVVALMVVLTAGILAEDAAGVLKLLKAKEAKMLVDYKDIKITMESSMQMDGMEMQNTSTLFIKGNKKRMEIAMYGMKNIMINDGKEIWLMSAQTGKKKMNSENEAGENPSPFGWISNMSEKDAKITEETVDGRKCFVFDGMDKKNIKSKWFIDKTSLVLVKYESTQAGKAMVLKNSDFKKVQSGYEIPHKIELYGDGKLMMTGITKSIEINKGLDDKLFNVDLVKQEDLGQMDMQKMMEMMKNSKGRK